MEINCVDLLSQSDTIMVGRRDYNMMDCVTFIKTNHSTQGFLEYKSLNSRRQRHGSDQDGHKSITRTITSKDIEETRRKLFDEPAEI